MNRQPDRGVLPWVLAAEMSCPRHLRFTPMNGGHRSGLKGTRIRLMQHCKQREPGIKRH